MEQKDVGVIGLAVMGSNLALNMSDNGFSIAGYDRNEALLSNFVNGPGADRDIAGCASAEKLCATLKTPRKILMMVRAGEAIDWCIEQLLPHLEEGDILIDGGNSHFPDTVRRANALEEKGLRYVGMGVSGGEEGARRGPCMMPGGSADAWKHIQPIFQAIAAKTDSGDACCQWVGDGGAGHFVKMIHNGIEYGDMQMICETYMLMKQGLGMSNEEMADVFEEWNEGELGSYLIEITRDILRYKNADGEAVIDQILDTAGQKGTGKWTAVEALHMGQPLTLIGEAVFARCLSALKEDRVKAAGILKGRVQPFTGDKKVLVKDLQQALYASKLVSYAQGYQLMRAAASEYGWNLNYGDIALLWRGGCIIRCVFLDKIRDAFEADSELGNLLLDPFFSEAVQNAQDGWRNVVSTAVQQGIPVPALSTALAYFDGYRSARLPANLLQAQRDYFGAHTYERIDRPRGEFFHTDWTGLGGDASASTYTV